MGAGLANCPFPQLPGRAPVRTRVREFISCILQIQSLIQIYLALEKVRIQYYQPI